MENPWLTPDYPNDSTSYYTETVTAGITIAPHAKQINVY